MKNKAFSYMEVIVSLFIFIIVFIPALKLNSNQIKTYKLIVNYSKEQTFLNSLLSYLKADKIFFKENKNYSIKNFSELKKNILFKNFKFSEELKEDFSLEIEIKKDLVDFYSKQLVVNIYKISFQKQKKKYQVELIKFEE